MQEAFSIGPLLVWTRVLFLLAGIWVSFEFFLKLAQSARLSLDHFRSHAWWYLGAFILIGRVAAIIGEYRVYVRDPFRSFVFWDGNFSFLGGAIGIAILIHWATRSHRSTFLQWLDVLFPATCFGIAMDWIGKFASGQSYGTPTDVFWGVTYDARHVRYVVPVHPVQMYYAIFFLLLTFLLLIIRKKANRAGSETLVGVLVASIGTFLLEYFRGDFSIPVFATQLDFLVLLLLFISLGVFAIIELRLTQLQTYIYESLLILFFVGYLALRSWLALPTYELRFTQFLSILALLATVVYVIVHRRKYPHL